MTQPSRWGAGVALAVSLAAGAASPESRPASRPQKLEPFAWSEQRRLNWSDFLAVPQIASGAAALTVYMLSIGHGCNGDVFSFRVESIFQPHRSWVQTSLLLRPAEADRVLRHEQSHFNLSEVHARQLRRDLGRIERPCERPVADIDKIASAQVLEDASKQQRYDHETTWGAHEARQLQWDRDIDRELKALAAYVH